MHCTCTNTFTALAFNPGCILSPEFIPVSTPVFPGHTPDLG